MTVEDQQHLDNVLRHIQNVRESCELLGTRLIERGEPTLGMNLIVQGLQHDASKIICEIEFKYLRPAFFNTDQFSLAFSNHVSLNLHHPEAWDSIEDMPRRYMAEMVCDWKSRSSEFGNDLMDWIKTKATEKFGFSTQGRVYKDIKGFVGILLDKGF